MLTFRRLGAGRFQKAVPLLGSSGRAQSFERRKRSLRSGLSSLFRGWSAGWSGCVGRECLLGSFIICKCQGAALLLREVWQETAGVSELSASCRQFFFFFSGEAQNSLEKVSLGVRRVTSPTVPTLSLESPSSTEGRVLRRGGCPLERQCGEARAVMRVT